MNEEIKVLQVIGNLGKGGDTSAVMTIVDEMKKRKPNVRFDFLTHNGCDLNKVKQLRNNGYNVFVLEGDVRKIGPIKYYFKVKELLKKNKYDIIHTHTSMQSGIPLFAAKKCGIKKRICHSHVTNIQRKASIVKKVIAIPIFRFLIKKYSNIKVACSQEAGEFLFKKQFFKVLYNGIDIEKFYYVDTRLVETKRKEYNIKNNEIVVGQIGTFFDMKNQQFTLEIARLAKLKNMKIIFILIGSGSNLDRLKKQAEKENLPVKFLGRKDSIEIYMKMFDVLIMPSLRGEGLPMTLVEAQVAGCKCIKSHFITEESDIGIGLCNTIKLDNNPQEWLAEIIKINNKNIKKVPIECLYRSKFNKENSVKTWVNIYC